MTLWYTRDFYNSPKTKIINKSWTNTSTVKNENFYTSKVT